MELKKKVINAESDQIKTSMGVKRKAALKSELSIQLKTFQEKFDTLENENKLQMEKVSVLEKENILKCKIIRNLELKLKQLQPNISAF